MEGYLPPKTISYCVNSVLADLDETSKRHYQKFLHYGIQGYRRLNIGNLIDTTIKTVALEVDQNTNTACLPDDYISFLKVGFSCHGYIVNLDYNSDLRMQLSNDIFPDACDCKDELGQCVAVLNNTDGQGIDWSGFPFFSSIWYYNSYWRNGQYNAGFYGRGAGHYRSSYIIDGNKREIQFSSYFRADFVILEYLSTGIEDGDAFIPEDVVPVITNYIHWKRCLHDPNISKGEAQYWERLYKQEARGLMARKAALSSWDWVNKWRNTFIASPKR